MDVSTDDATSLNLHGEVPRLEDYDVSPRTGFMYENSLRKLPEYFDPWWNIATRLQELVEARTLRDEVLKMPCLDHRRLNGDPEWRLASVVLSYITQCYVWTLGEKTFHSNLKPIVALTGGQDSAWFFMVAGQTEIDFALGLQRICAAQQAVKDLNVDAYIAALVKLELAIRTMRTTILRMQEKCQPWVFYNKIRPYLAGWTSKAFKDKGWKGLIYEGVSPEPFCDGGGSAAQSSTIPCLDAALGLKHQPSEATFCKNSKALQAYNACLTAVTDFRTSHIQLVTQYIIIMSHRSDSDKNHTQQACLGTGGTGFMQFLKGLRTTVKQGLYHVDEGTEIN